MRAYESGVNSVGELGARGISPSSRKVETITFDFHYYLLNIQDDLLNFHPNNVSSDLSNSRTYVGQACLRSVRESLSRLVRINYSNKKVKLERREEEESSSGSRA